MINGLTVKCTPNSYSSIKK